MNSNTYKQLSESPRKIITNFKQPMTAKQTSQQQNNTTESISDAFKQLREHRLIHCLNPNAARSRVYWLTKEGTIAQNKLRKQALLPELEHNFPIVDWDLYGWVCYSHRSAVIKAMGEPLQPSAIKRRARFRESEIKMSANNVRDVIRLFLKQGIVRKVDVRGQYHPRYELTKDGKKIQELLLNVGDAA